jgi:ankyrin repeat protein
MPDGRKASQLLVIIASALILTAALLTLAKEQFMKQENSPFIGKDNLMLAQAVEQGDLLQIAKLVTPERLDEHGDRELTLLQWAILQQQPDSLKALLEAGAKATESGMDGNGAMHTAAAVQDARYLQILLARNAPVNARNTTTGATPLAMAVLAGRMEQVHLLLEAGADATLADRLGDTPLHTAAKIGNPELILMLLQAGADAKARNQQGLTFLHYLAQTPAHLQNDEMRENYRQLNAWLKSRRLAENYQQP